MKLYKPLLLFLALGITSCASYQGLNPCPTYAHCRYETTYRFEDGTEKTRHHHSDYHLPGQKVCFQDKGDCVAVRLRVGQTVLE